MTGCLRCVDMNEIRRKKSFVQQTKLVPCPKAPCMEDLPAITMYTCMPNVDEIFHAIGAYNIWDVSMSVSDFYRNLFALGW